MRKSSYAGLEPIQKDSLVINCNKMGPIYPYLSKLTAKTTMASQAGSPVRKKFAK